MEFFTKAKAVRLRSHLEKYLVSDENKENVRQSRRQKSSSKSKWFVELVEDNSQAIHLKNIYGNYLTASDKPFLLGMTGKKVIQTASNNKFDLSIQWFPIRDGFQVKLKSFEGKFLRANGATQPWRNTVTTDIISDSSATKDWVLWDIETVDDDDDANFSDLQSQLSSLSSFSEDFIDSPKSPWSTMSTPKLSSSSQTMDPRVNFNTTTPTSKKGWQFGMELFHNAKAVRLRSHHEKYLIAEDDEESVTQDRNGSTKTARWIIEFIDGGEFIRLKSCYGKYLTASNERFLLGMTGRKVTQSLPKRLDSSIEWEPVRDGYQIKLKTRYGNFLRANGSVPPWRNSVTHDIPKTSKSQELLLWDVDILEIQVMPKPIQSASVIPTQEQHQHQQQNHEDVLPPQQPDSPPSPVKSTPSKLSRLESGDSSVSSSASLPVKSDGRMIYFSIANEDGGEIDDDYEEVEEEGSFTFKGKLVGELTLRLEEETGLEDIMVCTRSTLNGKLYPMRLHLPPNNAPMRVVVVPASSKAARDMKPGL